MPPAVDDNSATTIAVYAADATQRDTLAALARESGCRLAGATDTAAALHRLLAATPVDVILAPPASGVDPPAWLAAQDVPLIVLAPAAEIGALRGVLDRSGASLLPLPASPRALRLAIDAAREGLRLVPIAAPAPEATGAAAGDPLTPRELDVLNAMADGVSNKVIARRLGISFHTVKFHVAAVLEKLDADSRTEAVAEAARRGLVML
jgi:DNA-binding NarL/FixJ family response regulator